MFKGVLYLKKFDWSRDSAVHIATGYGLNGLEVEVRVLVRPTIFSSLRHLDRLCGPPNLLSNRYGGALSPGVKQSGREVYHSHPPSAEVKEMWIYTSAPPYPFMANCLIS
jgi:hypothetical protein